MTDSLPPKNRFSRDLTRFSAVGMELGVAIGLFVWIGSKFDEWLGTAPWLLLLGLFLGFFGGFYRLKLKLSAWDKKERGKSD